MKVPLRRWAKMIGQRLAGPEAPDPKDLWLQSCRQNGSRVHETLNFSGVEPPEADVQIGPNCILERDVTFWLSPEAGAQPTLRLADHVFIGQNTYLGVHEPITIGAYALIGAYSYIVSASHRYERRDIPIRRQGFTGAPIVIEDDVWLGTHVVVLPGVRIGKGAILAAGSVVNRDIPAYEVWGGAPARFLKPRPE